MKIDFKLEELPRPIPYTRIDEYFRDVFAPHYHKQFEILVNKIIKTLEE